MAEDYGYLYATGDELDLPKQPLTPMRTQSGRGTHRRNGSTETSATAKGPVTNEKATAALPAKSPRAKASPAKSASARPDLKTMFPSQTSGSSYQSNTPRVHAKPAAHSHGLRQAPPEPEGFTQPTRSNAGGKDSRWYESEQETAPRLASATVTSTTASEAGTIKAHQEMPSSVADMTRGMHGETLATLYLVSGLTKVSREWA